MTFLQKTQLWDLLNSDIPSTVFVPSDAAMLDVKFGSLTEGQLLALLTYHIAPGVVPSWDFFPCYRSKANIYTLQGSSLFVDIDIVDDIEYPTLNQAILTSTRDVFASNGVVHLLDDVLQPPTNMALGQYLQGSPDAVQFGMCNETCCFCCRFIDRVLFVHHLFGVDFNSFFLNGLFMSGFSLL